ncbi:hypothetical protein AwPolaro_07850 [Polaromonas sp.]|nr:hypothetical protein AwPolaro_07850 [Polaromonas sp.]
MTSTKFFASSVIALAAMVAGSAFAGDSSYPSSVASSSPSTVTRAQVQAELLQAQKNGAWRATLDDHDYPTIQAVGTPKTRAEVQAELAQAQKSGHWSSSLDDHSYPTIQAVGTPKTRAEVKIELDKARADGSLMQMQMHNHG